MMLYFCTKFHENILERVTVIEQKLFHKKNFKGHNSAKNGVYILVPCTLSDSGLYLH